MRLEPGFRKSQFCKQYTLHRTLRAMKGGVVNYCRIFPERRGEPVTPGRGSPRRPAPP